MKRYTVPDVDGNFAWAFKMMLGGALVRRRYWTEELSVTILPPRYDEIYPSFVWLRNGDACSSETISEQELLATDWEVAQ